MSKDGSHECQCGRSCVGRESPPEEKDLAEALAVADADRSVNWIGGAWLEKNCQRLLGILARAYRASQAALDSLRAENEALGVQASALPKAHAEILAQRNARLKAAELYNKRTDEWKDQLLRAEQAESRLREQEGLLERARVELQEAVSYPEQTIPGGRNEGDFERCVRAMRSILKRVLVSLPPRPEPEGKS